MLKRRHGDLKIRCPTGVCGFKSGAENPSTHRARPGIHARNGKGTASGGRLCEGPPRVPHERIQSAEEEHGSERGLQDRGAGAILTNGNNEQRHAGNDAEDRD